MLTATPTPAALFLGIECGGTRTVAILAEGPGRGRQRLEAGPANLRLLTDRQLLLHFRGLAARLPRPGAIGIGMAGVLEEPERERVRAAAAQAWPGLPCWAGNDLETGLAAAEMDRGPAAGGRVLMISGTGSCCYGRNRRGTPIKVGGWGHVLSDRGSAYDLGLQALRAVMQHLDETGRWPELGQRLLRRQLLNRPNELVTWAQHASKTEIAALALEIFQARAAGDPLARRIVSQAAQALATAAATCATRLAPEGAPVEFVLAGSVLLKQPSFAAAVRRCLRKVRLNAAVRLLQHEGAWGALAFARQIWREQGTRGPGRPPGQPPPFRISRPPESHLIPSASHPAPTEQRNLRSMRLDRMRLAQAIRLMLAEEARIPAALRQQEKQLERAVRLVVRAFRKGGRLFYVGAGTSGRLGVLDASECPPTFGTPPDMVQGIMAGGQTALGTSLEGAEDDWDGGAEAVRWRGVRPNDVVVGIAASGRTPFVWGALLTAKARKATTILICFNPHLEINRRTSPTLVIAPKTGPEILTGSTRLKAGTATKLILNMLTTLSMVQLGKVAENLMVDLHPSNSKLRERAVRIVMDLARTPRDAAQRALERSRWRIQKALAALPRKQ